MALGGAPLRGVCWPALLALGCAASATLHARPETVCAGRAVRLAWDGSGSGELSAEPADPSLGEVAASGSKSVRPKATTTYRFRVGSLVSSATSSTIVKVVSLPELPAPIRGSVSDEGSGCAPGRIWVTARVPAGAWDARLRVNLVASADGRALEEALVAPVEIDERRAGAHTRADAAERREEGALLGREGEPRVFVRAQQNPAAADDVVEESLETAGGRAHAHVRLRERLSRVAVALEQRARANHRW